MGGRCRRRQFLSRCRPSGLRRAPLPTRCTPDPLPRYSGSVRQAHARQGSGEGQNMIRIERTVIATIAIAAVVLLGSPARIASAASPDESSLSPTSPSEPLEERLFHFEWTTGPVRGGMTRMAGYVYNDYGRPMENVQFEIIALDASGREVGRELQRIGDTVPSRGRGYFDVEVPAGSSYRLDVLDYNFFENHGRN